MYIQHLESKEAKKVKIIRMIIKKWVKLNKLISCIWIIECEGTEIYWKENKVWQEIVLRGPIALFGFIIYLTPWVQKDLTNYMTQGQSIYICLLLGLMIYEGIWLWYLKKYKKIKNLRIKMIKNRIKYKKKEW